MQRWSSRRQTDNALFHDITVLEIAQGVSGPYATMQSTIGAAMGL